MGGTDQLSTVVQDQLKILYGVCIAHIHEGLYTINFESALYLRVLAKPI